MASQTPRHLSVRKKPRQARSTATVEAIYEAAIQVLVADGPNRLTTTRVAERAGVSVGTMYQYFPHKQALFYALSERYLDALAARVESACLACHGTSLDRMVETIVFTYWDAKMERSEVTQALYQAVVEIDNEPLIQAFAARVDAATAAMLASAPDADFAELDVVNTTLLAVVFGATRSVFERNMPASMALPVRRQLTLMCLSYLEAVRVRTV